MNERHIRDDYKEFLQVAVVFLAENSGSFRTPGPTSNACWIAKGIYSLNIFIFRDQFRLTAKELNGLGDV